MDISLQIPSDVDGLGLKGVVNVTASANPTPLRVEFFVDSALVAVDNAAPYAFAFDTTRYLDGTHTVRAEGVYKSRRSKTQVAVTIANNVAPTPTPIYTVTISGNPIVGNVFTAVIA